MNKKNIMKVVKIILIILLVIIVVFLTNAVIKFMIAKQLSENVKQYTSSENYHIKSISYDSDGTQITMNYYKKNDKELTIMERDKNGTTDKISIYNNGSRKDVFYDNSEGKKVELNTDLTIDVQIYDYFDMQSNLQLFGSNMFAKIKKVDYNGKECYLLNNSFTLTYLWGAEVDEIYIEKDTGLVVKSNIDNHISEREYEFDNVQDEIFAEPDISQYKLIEE